MFFHWLGQKVESVLEAATYAVAAILAWQTFVITILAVPTPNKIVIGHEAQQWCVPEGWGFFLSPLIVIAMAVAEEVIRLGIMEAMIRLGSNRRSVIIIACLVTGVAFGYTHTWFPHVQREGQAWWTTTALLGGTGIILNLVYLKTSDPRTLPWRGLAAACFAHATLNILSFGPVFLAAYKMGAEPLWCY